MSTNSRTRSSSASRPIARPSRLCLSGPRRKRARHVVGQCCVQSRGRDCGGRLILVYIPSEGSRGPSERSALRFRLPSLDDAGCESDCHRISWRSAAGTSEAAYRVYQRGDPEEPIAAESLRLGCKTTSLSVSKAQTPTAELLAKHPVLRLQVLDDVLLTAIHPSGDDQDQELRCSEFMCANVRHSADRPAETHDHPSLHHAEIVDVSDRLTFGTLRGGRKRGGAAPGAICGFRGALDRRRHEVWRATRGVDERVHRGRAEPAKIRGVLLKMGFRRPYAPLGGPREFVACLTH